MERECRKVKIKRKDLRNPGSWDESGNVVKMTLIFRDFNDW